MLMKTCSSCGGETYSAGKIERCVECGTDIDNVEAKPAGSQTITMNDKGFDSLLTKLKEG